MRTSWHRFLAPLTPGVRVLLLVLTVSYLIAFAGLFFRAYNLYEPFALRGVDFWKGKLWQIVTYALLPATLFDFLFNWLMILFLGSCMERVWSRRRLWAFCVISTIAAGTAKVLLDAPSVRPMVGTTPVVFGLLAACGYLCGNEKVLLYFIWEMPIRQAAIVLTVLSALLMLPCSDPKTVLIMLFGGLGSLVWLWIESRILRARGSQTVVSERMGRLEL
jgi:membrane associated rhomboid family serine protease